MVDVSDVEKLCSLVRFTFEIISPRQCDTRRQRRNTCVHDHQASECSSEDLHRRRLHATRAQAADPRSLDLQQLRHRRYPACWAAAAPPVSLARRAAELRLRRLHHLPLETLDGAVRPAETTQHVADSSEILPTAPCSACNALNDVPRKKAARNTAEGGLHPLGPRHHAAVLTRVLCARLVMRVASSLHLQRSRIVVRHHLLTPRLRHDAHPLPRRGAGRLHEPTLRTCHHAPIPFCKAP